MVVSARVCSSGKRERFFLSHHRPHPPSFFCFVEIWYPKLTNWRGHFERKVPFYGTQQKSRERRSASSSTLLSEREREREREREKSETPGGGKGTILEKKEEKKTATMKGRRKTTGETIFFDDAFEENVKRLEEHVKDTRDTSQELIEWCDTSTVERFLRADKGNLEKAKSRLKSTLLWRRDEMMPFCKCCFEDDSRSHYMHVVGRTRNGRPVVFSDIGLARNSKPKDNEAHATFCMEQVEKCLLAYPNDTYVWVSDFHKFGRQHLNPSVAKRVLGLFARHYPERMGAMVFVEAPRIFNILYKICEKFVDPTTMAKLRFVKGPTGLGGGKEFTSLLEDGHCDKETFEWIEREMMENRTYWKKVSEEKSWTKSHARNDGKYYYANPDHDIRGSEAFIREQFCVDMHAFCKKNVNMTTCLPIEDTRRVRLEVLGEEDEKEIEEAEFVLSNILERGDSASSLALPSLTVGRMKIVDGEGDENDDDDNDEFHDCREKFKTNILKTVIKKLSPSKNRRTCSQIAALNGD